MIDFMSQEKNPDTLYQKRKVRFPEDKFMIGKVLTYSTSQIFSSATNL